MLLGGVIWCGELMFDVVYCEFWEEMGFVDFEFVYFFYVDGSVKCYYVFVVSLLCGVYVCLGWEIVLCCWVGIDVVLYWLVSVLM